MNLLPNAGAHPAYVNVRVIMFCMAFVEPLDHGCHFATGGEEGEGTMTIIVARMVHLGPVGLETQVITLEPLCWIIAKFFNLALIHSSDGKAMEYWITSLGGSGLKVAKGVVLIASQIVPSNPGNVFPGAFWV
jgi:hypothetical protein